MRRRGAALAVAPALLAGCMTEPFATGGPMPHINYVELSGRSTERSKAFYGEAFGWRFVDYGPTYAGTEDRPTNVGIEADGEPRPPLPVIQVDDLEAAQRRVEAAGGRVVQRIFAFPGGRRFEFEDPDGNRLAVMRPDG